MSSSSLRTFKFHVDIKEPYVLRPLKCSLLAQIVLASIKTISVLPRKLFQKSLIIDCNERIVEIPFVLQNLASVEKWKILDFGCAESLMPIFLASRGAEVIGVDLREYEFQHPNFSFVKGDFLSKKYKEESFDAIVAISAVEHCGLNVYGSEQYEKGDRKVIQQFRKILKPNGLLVLTIPFGKDYVDDELRIYDSKQLSDLLKEFQIEKKEFYKKSDDLTYWYRCSEKECSTAGIDPVTGVQGVALLLCRKA